MSIKILDSDSAINLLERLRSFDCGIFLSRYRTIMTDIVTMETDLFKDGREKYLEGAVLSKKEIELSEWINDSIIELGPGERSTIVHALFMSNDGSDERIIIVSDDKEARHAFDRLITRSKRIRSGFPNLDRIVMVRSEDVLRRIMDDGMLNAEVAESIYFELYRILGPNRISFLRENTQNSNLRSNSEV